jgi:hypothetical protein
MALARTTYTPTISNGFSAGTTITISSAVVSGSDKVLYATVMLWQDVAGTGTVSGITWNTSENFTKRAEKTVTGGAMRAEIWELKNPTSTTANIVATISGNTDARKLGAILYTGADQTTPTEATQTSEGTSSPITLDITTLTDGADVIDCVSNFSTATLTVGASQTSFMNNSTGSTGAGASYESKATAGSVTMSWTKTGTDDWAQVAVSVKPLVTATNTGNFFAIL